MLIPLEIAMDGALTKIGLVLAGIFVLAVIAGLTIPVVQAFKSDLKYINMEINRTDGREQAHWKRRKRQLWLSLIPFYRPRRRHHHHDD